MNRTVIAMVDVVVIDDDPDLRTIIAGALRLDGRRVETAPGGCAGMDLLDRLADSSRPVVVLDVQMPDVDGWEVLSTMRASPRLADLAVVLCTVRSSDADQLRGLSLGADSFVTKPFDIDALCTAVDDLAAQTPFERALRRTERLSRLPTRHLQD